MNTVIYIVIALIVGCAIGVLIMCLVAGGNSKEVSQVEETVKTEITKEELENVLIERWKNAEFFKIKTINGKKYIYHQNKNHYLLNGRIFDGLFEDKDEYLF
jgi:uncharacterized membrane-anchored protein YhcB (DUF1043 family)